MSVDFSTESAASRTQRKCEAILTAAARTFLTVGFERANMDDIAAAADVSKRTIYAHYESKEGLFEAVVAALGSRVERAGSVAWDRSRSLEDQLLEIARGKLALFEDRHFAGLARMVIGVFAAQPDLARRAMRALEDCDNGIRAWLQSAQDNGALKGIDIAEANSLFGSLIMSILVWPMLSGEAVSASIRAARVDALARMFAAHLRSS